MSRSGQRGGQEQRDYDIISGKSLTGASTSVLQENYAASLRSQGGTSSSRHSTSGTGYPHGDSYTSSSGYPSGSQSSYGHGTHGGYDQSRVQVQDQRFRNAQASKQMVYGVYENALGMIEELENREAKEQGVRSMARSGFHVPSQSGHDKDTVKRKIDTQLLLLQSQLQSCDREILDDVKHDLQKKTLDWMSEREAKKLSQGKTDKYAGKLYEVLAKGKTNHPDEFYKSPSIGERDMKNAMGNIMKGQHAREQLDRDFKNDPSRRAVAPEVRPGAGRELGAERMVKVRGDLKTDVDRHRSGVTSNLR